MMTLNRIRLAKFTFERQTWTWADMLSELSGKNEILLFKEKKSLSNFWFSLVQMGNWKWTVRISYQMNKYSENLLFLRIGIIGFVWISGEVLGETVRTKPLLFFFLYRMTNDDVIACRWNLQDSARNKRSRNWICGARSTSKLQRRSSGIRSLSKLGVNQLFHTRISFDDEFVRFGVHIVNTCNMSWNGAEW